MMSINWDEAYASGRDYRVMNQLLLRKILAGTRQQSGTVLDIGCGTGDLAVKLAQLGYKVTGVDVSAVAIDKARERATQSNLAEAVKFEQADFGTPSEREPFDSEKFDLITCKLVLAFIQDKADFLEWVSQHLTPTGSFILITPVLHDDIQVSKRLENISVPLTELENLLGRFFKQVTEVHTEYFEEWGEEWTFILSA